MTVALSHCILCIEFVIGRECCCVKLLSLLFGDRGDKMNADNTDISPNYIAKC